MEINQKRVEFYQPDSNDVVKRIEDRELRRELSEAINGLPDKCKMVFKLSYLHDMKNKEIRRQKLLGRNKNVKGKEGICHWA